MAQQDNAVQDSPGNKLYPEVPRMRSPHLEFVYRLVAQMHPTDGYDIENVQGTGVSRSIGHIQSGTVRGPGINGIVVENSGADWAERVHSKKVRFHQHMPSFANEYRFTTSSMHDTLFELTMGIMSSFKPVAFLDQAPELSSTTMAAARQAFPRMRLSTSLISHLRPQATGRTTG